MDKEKRRLIVAGVCVAAFLAGWIALGGPGFLQRVMDRAEARMLTSAARRGDLDEVRRLVQTGADSDAPPPLKRGCNCTALQWASREGHVEVVRFLLDSVADPNASYWMSEPAVCLAVKARSRETIELLCVHGADLSLSDGFGKTPLHWATFLGKPDIVELLLAREADVNARGKFGSTPLSEAISWGYSEVAEILRRHGGTE